MSLWSRIKALEQDVAQAKRDHHLQPHWEGELGHALSQFDHVEHRHPLPRYGIDYAWGRPTPAAMRSAGVTFALRYLTGEGKALEASEAEQLTQAAIDIGSIFEEGAENMLEGAEGGTRDGTRALAAAKRIGMPPRRPIYFAADFDAQGQQIMTVLSYLKAAKHAMGGRYYAGIYGGLEVVKASLDTGFAYAYQTLAWSGGQWDHRAQLRQTSVSGPTIHGVQCDTDYAYAADFGQWRL